MKKTILSLCDYSGIWSAPYREAGYEVIKVDIAHGGDVRLLRHLAGGVHGILAAPPCTEFSRAGAHLWAKKGEAAIIEGLSVVDACLRQVVIHKPAWWALENPIGRLKDYMGEPVFKFDPCDFGDPWTKRTWLWGSFVKPAKSRVDPVVIDPTTRMPDTKDRARKRSMTSEGFARAFFAANP